jgi:hypothetical protein
VSWARFDNLTGQTRSIGSVTAQPTVVAAAMTSSATASTWAAEQARAPGPLPQAIGSFVKVQVRATDSAHPSWAIPVDVYFRRTANGWTLVGLERLP